MASPNPNFDTIASSTLMNYRTKLRENMLSGQVLFWQLKQRGFVENDRGGTLIVEPLMYGDNSTVKSYTGYDLLDVTPQTGFTSATFPWKYYAGSVVISGQEEFENSGDKTKVFNLLQAKIRQLEISMKKALNKALYADGSANGGKDITGLALAVENGSAWSTYGGIDSSAAIAAFWRNVWLDGSSKKFSDAEGKSIFGLSKLRNAFNSITKKGYTPSVIISPQDLYEDYEAYMEGVGKRYVDTKTADAGFQNITFKGVPWIFDEDMDTNEILLLSADALKFTIGQGRDFVVTPFQKPMNQDAKVSQTLLTANLVMNRRDVHARITGLAPGTT